MNFKALTTAYLALQAKSQTLHERTKKVSDAEDVPAEVASIAEEFAALDAEAEAITSGAKVRKPRKVKPETEKTQRKALKRGLLTPPLAAVE